MLLAVDVFKGSQSLPGVLGSSNISSLSAAWAAGVFLPFLGIGFVRPISAEEVVSRTEAEGDVHASGVELELIENVPLPQFIYRAASEMLARLFPGNLTPIYYGQIKINGQIRKQLHVVHGNASHSGITKMGPERIGMGPEGIGTRPETGIK